MPTQQLRTTICGLLFLMTLIGLIGCLPDSYKVIEARDQGRLRVGMTLREVIEIVGRNPYQWETYSMSTGGSYYYYVWAVGSDGSLGRGFRLIFTPKYIGLHHDDDELTDWVGRKEQETKEEVMKLLFSPRQDYKPKGLELGQGKPPVDTKQVTFQQSPEVTWKAAFDALMHAGLQILRADPLFIEGERIATGDEFTRLQANEEMKIKYQIWLEPLEQGKTKLYIIDRGEIIPELEKVLGKGQM